MLKGLGRVGALTASPAPSRLLQTHGPSRCCWCLWVAPKEEGSSGKHLSCFSELGSVCFLKGAFLSTLKHKINPVSQGCLDLRTPGPGRWVRLGSQPPRPTLLLGVLQRDDSSAKDAPWETAGLPLFLVFWAKQGLPAWLLTTKLLIHPCCIWSSRASPATPRMTALSSSTTRGRLEYPKQGSRAQPSSTPLRAARQGPAFLQDDMGERKNKYIFLAAPLPLFVPWKEKVFLPEMLSLSTWIGQRGWEQRASSHQASSSLLPIIFHTGRSFFQPSSNAKHHLDLWAPQTAPWPSRRQPGSLLEASSC